MEIRFREMKMETEISITFWHRIRATFSLIWVRNFARKTNQFIWFPEKPYKFLGLLSNVPNPPQSKTAQILDQTVPYIIEPT